MAILEYARKDEDTFSELELVTYYDNILQFDFNRGMTIPFCKHYNMPFIDGAKTLDVEPEVHIYHGTPFEFFPVGSQGGGGLEYGYLILAPELQPKDLPMVSYAPTDDFGVTWLGNNTKEGVESLLTAKFKSIHRNNVKGLEVFDQNEKKQFLCSHYGITPNRDHPEIDQYARLKRRYIPASIPEGWSYFSTNNGVGVLAETSTFNSALNHPEIANNNNWNDLFALAKTAFEQSYFGTALFIAHSIFQESFLIDKYIELSRFMHKCYMQLGKELLANKVDLSLKCWK